MPEHKGGKKSRKYGRNKDKCTKYKLAGRREKNKQRKALKRVKKEAYFAKRKAEREKQQKAA